VLAGGTCIEGDSPCGFGLYPDPSLACEHGAATCCLPPRGASSPVDATLDAALDGSHDGSTGDAGNQAADEDAADAGEEDDAAPPDDAPDDQTNGDGPLVDAVGAPEG
jgi:hypothetical protein